MSRRRTLEWWGMVVCQYEGRPRFASARFSSERLALTWLQRMRSAAAVGRVPLCVVVYRFGKVHRQFGTFPQPRGYGAA
jgi:hypothetical protein